RRCAANRAAVRRRGQRRRIDPRSRSEALMRKALVACVVLGALAAGACGGAKTSAPPAVVRTQIGADPASLSLIGKTDVNSEMLAALITDSLVKYDADRSPKPRLAESWEVSGDGLVW